MTIKEMCADNNICYNEKNPSRSLQKLKQIYLIEQIDKRQYNIIRKLTEDEIISTKKITRCKELLRKTICVQLSLCNNNTIRTDMKGYLELFNVVNNKYRYFTYKNMNEEKYRLLNDSDLDNMELFYFVEDVNPILYRMLKEVFTELEKEMLIYKTEHLMFALTKRFEVADGDNMVEFTKKWEATNDEIELYMKYYREFASELGYNSIDTINGYDKKKIKRMVCNKMNIGWAYFEYELVLNRNGLQNIVNNNQELSQLKNSLNKNVVHRISNSNQNNLKNIDADHKKDMAEFLIKNPH